MNARTAHPAGRALLGRLLALCRAPWHGAGAPPGDAHARRAKRLRDMAQQFEAALLGVPTWRANPLRARIRRAPSVTDLWHLRPAVFDALAVSLGQDLAQARLRPLNALFRSHGQRSGPLPFDARL
jgi:hypothetical protein